MNAPVKLSQIVEGMESQTDESSCFPHKKTGQVLGLSSEELAAAEEDDPTEGYPEWQQEQIKIIKGVLADEGDTWPYPRSSTSTNGTS